MLKKDRIITILLTFCLSIMLFRILPISSQSVWDYDPWYDLNDDGIIEMRDISGVARKFGASGDPTKNVTVTNFPDSYNMNITNLPLDENGNLRMKTPTYSKTMILCEDYHVQLTRSYQFICSAYVEGWQSGSVFIGVENSADNNYHDVYFMANNISYDSGYHCALVAAETNETGMSFNVLGPYLEIWSSSAASVDDVDFTVILYLQK